MSGKAAKDGCGGTRLWPLSALFSRYATQSIEYRFTTHDRGEPRPFAR
jgi:hypothetical protein